MKSESSATYIFSKGKDGVWAVLAARRKDKGDDDFGGLWNVPIGGREKDETTLDTAVRETKEESGIEIPKSDFISVGDSCYFENGEKHMFSNFVVIMKEKVNPGKGDGENSKFKWIPMAEIDKHKWAFGMDNTVANVFDFVVKAIEKSGKEQLNEYLDKNYMMPLKQFMNMTDEEKAWECAGRCPWLLTDFIESSEMGEKVDELIEKGELPNDLFDLESYEIAEYIGPLFKTTFSKYAEDFVQYVYRYGDTDVPLFCAADFVKEIHNEWLVHMTDNLRGVNHEGFSYGVEMEDLAYTPGRGTIKYKYGPGYNFAFEADDADTAEGSGYGKYCILFQASGVEIYHYGDEQHQVIFYGPSAKNLIFIVRADDYSDYSGMWCVLDEKASGYDKYLCHFDRLQDAVYWAIKNFPQYMSRFIGKSQQKNFERNRNKPKEQRWWLSENKGRTIVLTESQLKLINEKMDVSPDKFNSNIRYFLHQLISDPVNAQPPTALKAVGITRSKLINLLIKRGIIEKHEKLNDKDKDGNFKTATMKVSFTVKDKVPDELEYRVPKNDFDRKIEKLRREIFEKNVPTKAAEVYNRQLSEDGEGMGGATSAASSGAFIQPIGVAIGRKIDEEVDELEAKHSSGADFDKFDSEYMGKGCGSQVYGWGYYVTTDKETAKGYEDYFKDNPTYKIGSTKSGSYTYTVEIPDDNDGNYILWDGKPLDKIPFSKNFETFGEQYQKLASLTSPKEVSMMLSNMGYTGIKTTPFRNQKKTDDHLNFSSGANYVVFKDDDLKILKKKAHTKKADKYGDWYVIEDRGGIGNLYNPSTNHYFFGTEDKSTWPHVHRFSDEPNIVGITFQNPDGVAANFIDVKSMKLFYPETDVEKWPSMVTLPFASNAKFYIVRDDNTAKVIPLERFTKTPLFGNFNDVSTWADDYGSTSDGKFTDFEMEDGSHIHMDKNGKIINGATGKEEMSKPLLEKKKTIIVTEEQMEKIREVTTTVSVGDYQYDVPLGVDNEDETMQRHNGEGGSVSINHVK